MVLKQVVKNVPTENTSNTCTHVRYDTVRIVMIHIMMHVTYVKIIMIHERIITSHRCDHTHSILSFQFLVCCGHNLNDIKA